MTVAGATPGAAAVLAANPGLEDDPVLAEIWRRVQGVEDPCHVLSGYPVTIVDLGIVNSIEFDGREVRIRITYTEMGCAFAPRICTLLENTLTAMPGVEAVDVVYEPFPPWTPERMNERARALYQRRHQDMTAAIPGEAIRRRRDESLEA
jgi:metal-sulfur cluster biosynthetic enzyme